MKISFLRKEHIHTSIILLVTSLYPTVHNYFTGEKSDYITFLIACIVCSVCFFPNYFSKILVLRGNKLVIKEGVFQKSVSMDIDDIKSVTLSELNNEPISIVFELHGKNQINWKTRDRTK